MRQRILIHTVCLLLAISVLCQVSQSTSRACEPVALPWFAAHYEIDAINLPEGIWLGPSDSDQCYRVINSEGEVRVNLSGILALFNQADYPVYVFGESCLDQLITAGSDQQSRLDELTQTLTDRQEGYEIPPDLGACFRLAPGGASGLDDRNVIDFGRPNGVTVPESQTTIMVLVSQERVVPITVKLGYILNPEYRSTSEQCPSPAGVQPLSEVPVSSTRDNSRQANLSPYAFTVLLAAISALILIAVWLKRKGRLT